MPKTIVFEDVQLDHVANGARLSNPVNGFRDGALLLTCSEIDMTLTVFAVCVGAHNE